MTSRPLDDRIRELYAKAVDAQQSDSEPIFADLKAALREHAHRLRELAAGGLATH